MEIERGRKSVCVCCVCVCEREREGERERSGETEGRTVGERVFQFTSSSNKGGMSVLAGYKEREDS